MISSGTARSPSIVDLLPRRKANADNSLNDAVAVIVDPEKPGMARRNEDGPGVGRMESDAERSSRWSRT